MSNRPVPTLTPNLAMTAYARIHGSEEGASLAASIDPDGAIVVGNYVHGALLGPLARFHTNGDITYDVPIRDYTDWQD